MTDLESLARPVRDVIVFEGHNGIRSYLKTRIDDTAGVTFRGEAADCVSARRLFDEYPGAIVITDPLLRPYGAFDVIEARQRQPSAGQVITYARDIPTNTVIDQAIRLKGSIICGEDSEADLINSLQAASEGKRYFSESIRDRFLVKAATDPQVALSENIRTLTPKRLAVLLLMAWGYSVKEASVELDVSVKAVDSQLDRLRKGLGIRNRVDLAMLCLKEGLINGHVEGFLTFCPICRTEIRLGIAQWIQAGKKRLEVTCRECCYGWACRRDQIQRRPFERRETAEPTSPPITAPHFGQVNVRVDH